jgi:hypothetical protein
VNILRAIALWLVKLVRILLYEWIVALVFLVRALCRDFRRWLKKLRLPGREGKVSDDPCVPIGPGRVRHPDPLIYSQGELMKQGLAVTWDNPDVQLVRAGVPISSWDLDPSTEYEIVARVWNRSTDAPVIGLPVSFSVLSFGIGAKLELVGVTSIPHLGVKGGPDNPAFCWLKWTTPATPGHYCIQVLLEPNDDANFGNNLGAENTLVGVPQSPAEFTFELRNDTGRERTYWFETDTYRIPELPPCREKPPPPPPRGEHIAAGPVRPETGRAPVSAAHDRRNYPVPEGWRVEITPERPTLGSGASIPIKVLVTPPSGFVGRRAFNVNGFNDLGLAGGVTLYVDSA